MPNEVTITQEGNTTTYNIHPAAKLAGKSVMACAELCRACAAACVECIRVCMASAYANTAACKACMEACHHCIAVCELCAAICESGNLEEIQKACMECMVACDACAKACATCAEKCPDCKDACSYCASLCGQCGDMCRQVCGMGMSSGGGMSMKMSGRMAVKAVGDWELDVLAIPFNSVDSDGQWFDASTDIMAEAFQTPLAVYQHGIQQGAKDYQGKLVIVGKSKPGSLTKQSDGWHVRVVLDKTVKLAKDIMDAAWKGLVAVSSGSIAHLARLDIGGKLIPYEKARKGRIAIWPLAEVSLWEKGNGNAKPANQFAMALPAMKAMYRDAGVPFPDVTPKPTDGVLPGAAMTAAKRARREEILNQSKRYLEKLGEDI